MTCEIYGLIYIYNPPKREKLGLEAVDASTELGDGPGIVKSDDPPPRPAVPADPNVLPTPPAATTPETQPEPATSDPPAAQPSEPATPAPPPADAVPPLAAAGN